jgi:hypothetical protein
VFDGWTLRQYGKTRTEPVYIDIQWSPPLTEMRHRQHDLRSREPVNMFIARGLSCGTRHSVTSRAYYEKPSIRCRSQNVLVQVLTISASAAPLPRCSWRSCVPPALRPRALGPSWKRQLSNGSYPAAPLLLTLLLRSFRGSVVPAPVQHGHRRRHGATGREGRDTLRPEASSHRAGLLLPEAGPGQDGRRSVTEWFRRPKFGRRAVFFAHFRCVGHSWKIAKN